MNTNQKLKVKVKRPIEAHTQLHRTTVPSGVFGTIVTLLFKITPSGVLIEQTMTQCEA